MGYELSEILKKSYHYSLESNTNIEDDNNNRIIEVLNSLADMDNMTKSDFFKRVFEGVFNLIIEAEKGSFFELSGEKYIPIFSKGYNMSVLQKLEFDKKEFFIGFECQNVSNIEVYQTYVKERNDTKFNKELIKVFKELGTYSNFTTLYAPIKVNNENVGLICLERFDERGFSPNSIKVLKFYTKIISDFYSQKIIQYKQAKLYDEIIAALVSAIEIKDKYTMGHALRVKKFSCAIAEELQLSESYIRDISTAALLHDIGKIGIKEDILNKPGKLSKDEFDNVKLHTTYGKSILENISEFSSISDFAFTHHENYDGTGYPLGLKGNEIPLGAQIIQVADAFDAMTSERAYRKAFSTNQALEIIEKEMGKQFSPEICKIAIKLFKLE
jgi:polar amino acid transport system substrate-binding protein